MYFKALDLKTTFMKQTINRINSAVMMATQVKKMIIYKMKTLL